MRLGLDASLDHAFGTANYLQHITETPVGELSAFANVFGGVRRTGGDWQRDFGVTGGVELRW